MAKKTQIEKAIEALESEMRVLQMAIDKLKAQQTSAPKAAKAARARARVVARPNGADHTEQAEGRQ